MRSAPPVIIPVGRFVWGWAMGWGLALLTALLLLGAWRVSGTPSDGAAAAVVIFGVLCAWSWRLARQDALPPGELDWDGQGWHYHGGSGDSAAVRVRVVWDLGPAMLVGVESEAGAGLWPGRRYTWLAACGLPGRWHAWRCAVFGRDIL